ncbi:MAG: hypothetical protein AB1896_19665 [Thermodesulfobacteriota bacterium]
MAITIVKLGEPISGLVSAKPGEAGPVPAKPGEAGTDTRWLHVLVEVDGRDHPFNYPCPAIFTDEDDPALKDWCAARAERWAEDIRADLARPEGYQGGWSPEDLMRTTDAGMARVVEDILAILEVKGVLNRTELAQAAQDKIAAREALRAKW